ncbi:hypothetical protein GO497_12930 [Acidovorax citrulli]|nr:hypothetical protein [Paracidovorax citrulli]
MMKVHTKNDTGISMMPPASALPFTASRSATLACLLVAATGLPGAAAAATPNGTAASAALECPATVQLEAPGPRHPACPQARRSCWMRARCA